MLTVGTKAPDFILNDQNGAEIRVSDFLGKKVVLYFTPRTTPPAAPARPAPSPKLTMHSRS